MGPSLNKFAQEGVERVDKLVSGHLTVDRSPGATQPSETGHSAATAPV